MKTDRIFREAWASLLRSYLFGLGGLLVLCVVGLLVLGLLAWDSDSLSLASTVAAFLGGVLLSGDILSQMGLRWLTVVTTFITVGVAWFLFYFLDKNIDAGPAALLALVVSGALGFVIHIGVVLRRDDRSAPTISTSTTAAQPSAFSEEFVLAIKPRYSQAVEAESPAEAEKEAQRICCEENGWEYEPEQPPLLIAGVIACESGRVPELVDEDPLVVG